jgi:hypothetical protein
MHGRPQTYGLERHIEYIGGGTNLFRTEHFAQPKALQPGDELASGHKVWEVGESYNGGVLLKLDDFQNLTVPSRIPLLLAGGENGKLPLELEVGDILETGEVVLDGPTQFESDHARFRSDKKRAGITITGGSNGVTLSVHRDLIIATSVEKYPPAPETLFGGFVIRETLKMGAAARKHLPNYGRLDVQSERDRIAGIFEVVASLKQTALEQRLAYQETLSHIEAQCKELKGVQMLVTGRLQGRANIAISGKDPQAWLQDELVQISSASVYVNQGQGLRLDALQPFIAFTGFLVKSGEQVSAVIRPGEFGVSVAYPDDANDTQGQA